MQKITVKPRSGWVHWLW